MKEIITTNGHVVLVDDEDYAFASSHIWTAYESHGIWYAVRRGKNTKRKVCLHQLLMPVPAGHQVDHKNGNGLDNRRTNLRAVTRAENLMNKRRYKNNTSGYKGVSLHRGRQWQANIGFNGRFIYLGLHGTAEEAARAYDAKAKELFGRFARLNFPDG